jgi:hypothetical protein
MRKNLSKKDETHDPWHVLLKIGKKPMNHLKLFKYNFILPLKQA